MANRFRVLYGRPPFNIEIGSITQDDDNPDTALRTAVERYAGVVPDGEVLEEHERHHLHPVVCLDASPR
jgi:hypothetical protein